MFVQEVNDSSTNNLSVTKNRLTSEMNGQSPAHQKVQRSVSSSQKSRRYSDQGDLHLRLNLADLHIIYVIGLCGENK